MDDALDLAALAGTRLSVVAVASPAEPPDDVETEAVIESARHRHEALLTNLRSRARAREIALETQVLVGHPADQVLRAAAAREADLIVVGRRGRSPNRVWVFGSTSRRIVAYASCSFLVVRSRRGAADATSRPGEVTP